MNERITELMIEAGKTILGDKHIDADFCDKFAELIVQECEQVSLQNSHRDDDMGAIIARKIKQHFGVEE